MRILDRVPSKLTQRVCSQVGNQNSQADDRSVSVLGVGIMFLGMPRDRKCNGYVESTVLCAQCCTHSGYQPYHGVEVEVANHEGQKWM